MRATFTLVAVLAFAATARADKIGPPESHATESADGKFVFVMLAPKAESFDGYKQSGLYKKGAAEPLWTVDWYTRQVAVANDGVHVVRIPGPHAYAERLNEDRAKRVLTEKDAKLEALAVVAKGKVVKEFTIGDFVDDVKTLPKSVTFFRWRKELRVLDAKGQLEVVTLEGNRVLIDLASAKILEKKKAQ